MEVKGKGCIVTGGAGGLGAAFTEALLREGAKVCFCDIQEDLGKNTLKIFSDKYGSDNVMFQRCDVTNQSDMEDLFKKAKERFGRLDIICNNAGMGGEKYPLWEKTVDVNVKGMIRGSLIALEHLRTDRGGDGGVIINISSAAGLAANPFSPVYCATKSAIIALTRSLACNPEVKAAGVRVNTLCPAFADTALVTGINEENCYNVSGAKAFVDMTGVMTTAEVAVSFMELVKDESRNGAVLRVSKKAGQEYCQIEIKT